MPHICYIAKRIQHLYTKYRIKSRMINRSYAYVYTIYKHTNLLTVVAADPPVQTLARIPSIET